MRKAGRLYSIASYPIFPLVFFWSAARWYVQRFLLGGEAAVRISEFHLRSRWTSPKCPIVFFLLLIFVSNMQVLGKLSVKAAMTIHWRNLHHWRLGSYHFLCPIRRGRAAEAQFFFLTHSPNSRCRLSLNLTTGPATKRQKMGKTRQGFSPPEKKWKSVYK